MIHEGEKRLGEWLTGEGGIITFNKHSLVWQVCIKAICNQNWVKEKFGFINPQNVMDYIHNKLNYQPKTKGGHNG